MKRIFCVFLILISNQYFNAQKQNYRLLIGTYTNTNISQGIYIYNIDLNSTIFTQKSVATGIANPSFLAISSDKKHLYSVSESPNGSTANAFSFDATNSKLSFMNASATNGAGPCFISVSEKHVVTANYSGGSISVFGRNADGSLTNVLQVIKHSGKSANVDRQSAPHVHQVIFTRDYKYLIANDLGTDFVTVYSYNPSAKNNILEPYDSLKVKSGSGPRHLTFLKDGKIIFLLQELDGTISVIQLKKGKLKLMQETTVARKIDIENRGADIHLSPDGKFLYATNRGTANDITCFSINKNGHLSFIQQIPTEGIGPRNFAITPDGKYIFIANQYTNNIVVFKRDIKSGLLIKTDKQIEVGAPVCLLFY